jgi:hypothetical protein
MGKIHLLWRYEKKICELNILLCGEESLNFGDDQVRLALSYYLNALGRPCCDVSIYYVPSSIPLLPLLLIL